MDDEKLERLIEQSQKINRAWLWALKVLFFSTLVPAAWALGESIGRGLAP